MRRSDRFMGRHGATDGAADESSRDAQQIVMRKPPGSLPGISSLAMMPTTRPNTIHRE